MSTLIDNVSPVGRLVEGHPMELHPVTDDAGVQKITKAGQPSVQCYVGLAIPKGPEQHWNQTAWGQVIQQAGVAGWPAGEHQQPAFAWKIVDGDSTIPNKKGRRPCDKEGFQGHWVVSMSSGFSIDCYNNGNYTQKIMRADTFKRGDYIRCIFTTQGNAPSQSPGVYINLRACELIRAGQEIIGASSVDASATFGQSAAVLPQGAMVDPNVQAAPVNTTTDTQTPQNPAPATGNIQQENVASSAPQAPVVPVAPSAPTTGPITPDNDFLTVQGTQYSVTQLRGFNWSEAQIEAARAQS